MLNSDNFMGRNRKVKSAALLSQYWINLKVHQKSFGILGAPI